MNDLEILLNFLNENNNEVRIEIENIINYEKKNNFEDFCKILINELILTNNDYYFNSSLILLYKILKENNNNLIFLWDLLKNEIFLLIDKSILTNQNEILSLIISIIFLSDFYFLNNKGINFLIENIKNNIIIDSLTNIFNESLNYFNFEINNIFELIYNFDIINSNILNLSFSIIPHYNNNEKSINLLFYLLNNISINLYELILKNLIILIEKNFYFESNILNQICEIILSYSINNSNLNYLILIFFENICIKDSFNCIKNDYFLSLIINFIIKFI